MKVDLNQVDLKLSPIEFLKKMAQKIPKQIQNVADFIENLLIQNKRKKTAKN